MIIGTGCDLIAVARVAKACAREGFVKRVFTATEIAYCKGRGKQAPASFAARFAAKEALLKALGTGLRGGKLTEINIINDSLGKPSIELRGYFAAYAKELGVVRVHLSLSHTQDQAMAMVVLEG